ncbi:hypothetical protein V6N11_023116 [Hibiscus sabdariffa]|uniref:Uncharacterized protein n=1 Tax=Hibiscus sabdariffa TaxID=183260 RepID=A0ABR2TL88_9ROSI
MQGPFSTLNGLFFSLQPLFGGVSLTLKSSNYRNDVFAGLTHGEASSRALPLSITPKANLANQCPRNKNPGFPLKLFLHATGNIAAKVPYNQENSKEVMVSVLEKILDLKALKSFARFHTEIRMDLHLKNPFDRFQEQFGAGPGHLFLAGVAARQFKPYIEQNLGGDCAQDICLMSDTRKIQIGLAQNNIFFVPSALEEMVGILGNTRGEIQFRNPTLEELKFVYAFMRTLLWQAVYLLRWMSSALCGTLEQFGSGPGSGTCLVKVEDIRLVSEPRKIQIGLAQNNLFYVQIGIPGAS